MKPGAYHSFHLKKLFTKVPIQSIRGGLASAKNDTLDEIVIDAVTPVLGQLSQDALERLGREVDRLRGKEDEAQHAHTCQITGCNRGFDHLERAQPADRQGPPERPGVEQRIIDVAMTQGATIMPAKYLRLCSIHN